MTEAHANENIIFNICEDDDVLTLNDERIESAIKQTGAKLVIFDPIQGYVGSDTDINRANEIRTVMRRISKIAEETGCAIVFIGHLNKLKGTSSAYRGLGSIDFRASARSVLLVGRLSEAPNVRVIVHDKSSLAPEGKSMAFNLGNEEGFYWLDGYDDVTADELLCGNLKETKTEAAEELLRELFSKQDSYPSKWIQEKAEEKNISQRTLNIAKSKMKIFNSVKVGEQWFWVKKNDKQSIK